MSECKCSMATSALGDGCRYCQPQEYIDRLLGWLSDAESEAEMAEELALCLSCISDVVPLATNSLEGKYMVILTTPQINVINETLTNYRKSKGE